MIIMEKCKHEWAFLGNSEKKEETKLTDRKYICPKCTHWLYYNHSIGEWENSEDVEEREREKSQEEIEKELDDYIARVKKAKVS